MCDRVKINCSRCERKKPICQILTLEVTEQDNKDIRGSSLSHSITADCRLLVKTFKAIAWPYKTSSGHMMVQLQVSPLRNIDQFVPNESSEG